MKPYRLGFDVDDVLAQLLKEWVFRYNTFTFDNVNVEDILGWDVSPYMKKMDKVKVYEVLDHPEFYRDVDVHEGALAMVKWARTKQFADGSPMFRVMFITSCMFPTHADQKLEWLINNGFFGDINPKNWRDYASVRKDYFPVSDKSVINVDFLVDDNVNNCATSMGIGLLVTRAHNKDISIIDTPNVYRVNSLTEVPSLIASCISEGNWP